MCIFSKLLVKILATAYTTQEFINERCQIVSPMLNI